MKMYAFPNLTVDVNRYWLCFTLFWCHVAFGLDDVIVSKKNDFQRNQNHPIASPQADNNCSVIDQKFIYSLDDAKRAAQRDYIENSIKLYGVPDGLAPIFPGESTLIYSVKNLNKVVIWPTHSCGEDLSYEQAWKYADIYNQEVLRLLSRNDGAP